MKKIGIYGGSFNPPHNGHLAVLKLAQRKMKLDEIWIIPSRYHRFKDVDDYVYNDVTKMCDLSFPKKIRDTNIYIRHDRKEWGGSTYKMMCDYKKERPRDKFYIMIGSDCAFVIKSYLNWKKLVKEHEFLIFARQGTISGYVNMNDEFKKTFRKHTLLFPSVDSSSSKFKYALSKIHPDVLEYIYDHKLYLSEEKDAEKVV